MKNSWYNDHKGIKVARLKTAVKIDDSIRKEIEKVIIDNTKAKTIELTSEVDADIIGGFVLQYEDKLFDGSISGSLEDLRREFSKNIYIKKI